ncbi:MAG: asparaginase [Lachnospiraceae bacterium]|nr:asparaginase [Lachnospiraceae bacterium]
MKHILMLSTGGTIASKQTGHGLQPEIPGDDLVAEITELKNLCKITCRQILNLDSSNIQPEDWMTMAQAVCDAQNDFDGIVITHGTDTMAYSASALSFMLQNLQIPVILTGSQLSIEEDGTDAKQNILDAFRTAITELCGIYIVFYGKIIRGTRAKKMFTKDFDAFHSINAEDIGQIKKDGTVIINELVRPKNVFSADICIDPNIFVLKLVPGTDPTLLDTVIDMGYHGIIIEAFGCGGIPNQTRSLLPCLKKAKEHGVSIIIASQCTYETVDLTVYDVNVQAAKLGAISGLDMTIETLTTKLMWALGHTTDPQRIQEMMHTCYSGEFRE